MFKYLCLLRTFMNLTLSELDFLENKLAGLDLAMDFIPDQEELDIMETDIDRYALFLMYLADNHPEPENRMQKDALHRLLSLRNKALVLTDIEKWDNDPKTLN